MTADHPIRAAVIGSGNIGTDLLFKSIRGETPVEIVAMAGIDPNSDGLARAARLGLFTTAEGVDGLIAWDGFASLDVVFDATSAATHVANDARLAPYPVRVVDLTPAAIGPYVVPAVNLEAVGSERNVNMVTCGGQATIPVVAAVSAVHPVHYGEIVASIASRSAGPGTRANIDEFTETTARAIESVGGAGRGKAIIVLNPADPPLIMRDTVICLVGEADPDAVTASIERMVERVAGYVPGYRLVQPPQFESLELSYPFGEIPPGRYTKVTTLLEVEGAGHYLPAYAGNLDIMTAAAIRAGEVLGAGALHA